MLNDSEKKVLDAITEYIAKNQFAPSYRELCELTGYASPSTIHSKIKALIQKGYIEAVKPRKCALRLKQPAADVQEVRHGQIKWVNRPISAKYATVTNEYGEKHHGKLHDRIENNPVGYCDQCGKRLDDTFMNYCPNCGAKMGGKDDAK